MKEPKPTTTSSARPTLRSMAAQLDRIEAMTLLGAKSVYDLTEAALYTGFSTGHLYRLTSQRRIPHFKKDRKLYFRKEELDAWMTDNPVPTAADTQAAASTYCSTHKS